MNTERLDDKTIVITGAGSGMGAAMAKEFASRGAKIAIFDLNDEKGKQVAEEIQQAGGTCMYLKVDVTRKREVEDAADMVEEKLGKLTSWINSAGVSRMVPFLDCEESLWDLTINVNLKATFLCCQAAVKRMLAKPGLVLVTGPTGCGPNMPPHSVRRRLSSGASSHRNLRPSSGTAAAVSLHQTGTGFRTISLCPGVHYPPPVFIFFRSFVAGR